jgi:membrane-bound serine protease (ClpP class)
MIQRLIESHKKVRAWLGLMIIVPAVFFAMGSALWAKTESGRVPLVYRIVIDGSVNPALADFIIKGIEKAEKDRADALVVLMDTPGGLYSTTKTAIKAIMGSEVPVIVYVAPAGSSASSAGALITLSADVAAMAPGTNIGAAHPIPLQGGDIGETMSQKLLNDMTAYIRGIVKSKGRNEEWAEMAIRESVSVTAQEALELNAIDVVADSVADLLNKIDGRKIEKKGRTVTLHTKNARVEPITTGWRFEVLDTLADPNIVYILIMIGGLCVLLELYNPGMIFPIVIGSICLLLAGFALQVLPINYVGLLLLILGVVLFILEVKIVSFGLLSVGGVACLTLGSIMLFETGEQAMRVSWSVIIPTVLGVSAFFIGALGLAVRAWKSKPTTGEQGMVGEVGVAVTDLENEGKVYVHGEYWNARSDGRIPKGEKVRVIRTDKLSLVVTREFS